jgi:hypothetical protein
MNRVFVCCFLMLLIGGCDSSKSTSKGAECTKLAGCCGGNASCTTVADANVEASCKAAEDLYCTGAMGCLTAALIDCDKACTQGVALGNCGGTSMVPSKDQCVSDCNANKAMPAAAVTYGCFQTSTTCAAAMTCINVTCAPGGADMAGGTDMAVELDMGVPGDDMSMTGEDMAQGPDMAEAPLDMVDTSDMVTLTNCQKLAVQCCPRLSSNDETPCMQVASAANQGNCNAILSRCNTLAGSAPEARDPGCPLDGGAGNPCLVGGNTMDSLCCTKACSGGTGMCACTQEGDGCTNDYQCCGTNVCRLPADGTNFRECLPHL